MCNDTMFLSCRPAAPPPSMISISPIGFSPKLYDQNAGHTAHWLAGMCAMSATKRDPVPNVSLDSRRTEARPWSEVDNVVVESTPMYTWPFEFTFVRPLDKAADADW